jgi:hypothetical protein
MEMKVIIYSLVWLVISVSFVQANPEILRGADGVIKHSKRGIKMYEAIDSNKDGNLDTFYYYDVNGLLERQEIDSNHTGKIDLKIYFVDGVYISIIEKDTTGDGVFNEKRHF